MMESKRVGPAAIIPERYWLFGLRMNILLSGGQTNNELSLIEAGMPPGGDGGLHVHINEDESMYLISGKLEVTIGDYQFLLSPGESYFAPKNVPHRVRNTGSAEARCLLINTPGTFDSFIRKAGIPLTGPDIPPLLSPEQTERLSQLAEQSGIHILIPPHEEGTSDFKGIAPMGKHPVHSDDSESYLFFGTQTVVRLSGDQTGLEFSLIENILSTGCDVGLHVHANEDESIYLLSGEIELTISDSIVILKPGRTCFIPRNVPHRLRNKGKEEAKILLINTPGTLDSFVKLAGTCITGLTRDKFPVPKPEQIAPILRLAKDYDFHMLVPPNR